MSPRTFLAPVALAAAVTLLVTACGDSGGGAAADADGDWRPNRPIEYVAPAGAGGGWDTLARTTARVLEDTDLVGQRMNVVNKPGGGGAIGWAYMAAAAGDPHKLFVTSPPIILVPLAGESDQDHTDFTPIARLITDYMTYLVPADSPYTTIEDLFAAIGDDPAGVSVAGGSAPGSMDHIALVGAAQAAGVDPRDVNYVPFDGGGEALTALLGGHVDAAVSGVGESIGQIESGQLRALAVSAPERVASVPDVPTLTESGIDFTFDIWRGVMGPPDLTDAQVRFYEQVFADMIALDSWATERDKLGWIDAYQDSAEFGAFLDEQKTLFESILTDLGLLG